MAGVREKLLTASDLATLCEVDLKTIHNWVDRGRIAHFRTPGRHLRFRAADVADFLRAWGYSVPRELAKASSRTLMVIGSKETVALVTRALGDSSPQPPGTAGGPQAAGSGTPSGGIASRGALRTPAKPGSPVGAPLTVASGAPLSTGSPAGAPLSTGSPGGAP